jgi:lipopolysaccharide/colanic/teichoic acid biosynthesis glycosyltransferase
MIKRIFDIIASVTLVTILSPLLIIFSFLIWTQDWNSPFYISPRVGKNNNLFKMIKFRSMIINADKSGVDSTGANDSRITKLGTFIRKYKIDELPNLINIILGEMSFVGPRPNVSRETNLYTEQEKSLLAICPGMTDLSSIVFSDEGDILESSLDPDLDYNQLIRPWKSRLGIFYVESRTFFMDLKLIILTLIAILSKKTSLRYINKILLKNNASEDLIKICLRLNPLVPHPPPGSNQIVKNRN